MQKIELYDNDNFVEEITLRDDIDLRYVAYAICEYGEKNGWFEEDDWYCVKCGKTLNPKYDNDLCSTCAGERGR